MTQEQIKQIQNDYETLTLFDSSTLSNLAAKYNISLEELLNIIDL